MTLNDFEHAFPEPIAQYRPRHKDTNVLYNSRPAAI